MAPGMFVTSGIENHVPDRKEEEMLNQPIETKQWIVDWRTVGPFAANSYLLVCKETREAALIDACDNAPVLRKMIEKHGATLRYLLQTHAHLDHVAALAELKEWSGAPIVLHPQEKMLYENVEQQCLLFGLKPFPSPPPPDQWITDGQIFALGKHEIRAIPTPGHSPGSVSFHGGEYLFAGDVLFAGSVGRTDLPGGSMKVLLQSISRLFDEVGEAYVFPGHGPVTRLSEEKAHNPFLLPLRF